MQIELNFWNEPDWKRESTINPRFLAVAGLFFVIVILLGLFSWAWSMKQVREDTLNQLRLVNQQHMGAIREIERQQECIRFWRKVRRNLEVRGDKRIVWSQQLAALQRRVPERILLSKLHLRSSRREAVDDQSRQASRSSGETPAPTRPIYETRYQLTIRGRAYAENADKVIREFSRSLPRDPVLGAAVETVQLTDVAVESTAEETDVPVKKFTIVCRYKPIRWKHERRSKND